MTDFELKAIIVVIFLAAGIAVGVLIVVALPQIRFYRRARHYLDYRTRELPPPPEDQEKPPWWQDG